MMLRLSAARDRFQHRQSQFSEYTHRGHLAGGLMMPSTKSYIQWILFIIYNTKKAGVGKLSHTQGPHE